MKADTVYINGKIITMDTNLSIAEAVAIKFERFVKVGSTEEINKTVGEDTRVIDLEGKTVVPGLIDSHCHMMAVGAQRLRYVDLSQEAGVRNIDDLVERIATVLGARVASSGVVMHERQRIALESAIASLGLARNQLDVIPPRTELIAEHIRQAIRALELMVGRIGVENLLDEIFASFCIGK